MFRGYRGKMRLFLRLYRNLWDIVMAVMTISLLTAAAHADGPGVIEYKGKLTDSSGNPLTQSLSITFRIYGAASGGSALFTEARTVPVVNGVFNVHIGSTTGGGIPKNVFQGGTERY